MPTAVETQVLTQCRRRCCLCFYLSRLDQVRKGQIAHLNKDPTDHRFENLAYLCLEHHDEFDSTSRQSKGISPAELRHYRDRLYHHYASPAAGPGRTEKTWSKVDESALNQSELDHLRLATSARMLEWRRLRADFEAEAKLYPKLTLTIYVLEKNRPGEDERFGSPNHAVPLWQFFSDATSVLSLETGRMGVRGADVSAFGVIVGEKTEQFVRMASRAGSMLPDDLTNPIANNVIRTYGQANAKPLFVSHVTPLAKWLNLVLVSAVAFQPERLSHNTLPVDPFAASLTALDLLSPPNNVAA